MQSLKYYRNALALAATCALLAGCNGGPSRIVPANPQFGSERSAGLRTSLARDASWMAPGTKSENLLYIADGAKEDVLVYSYPPHPIKLVGKLTGFNTLQGECVDAMGDVWIVTFDGAAEYKHGGTNPIAKVHESNAVGSHCAVDVTTGDLAVTYDWLPSCNSFPTYCTNTHIGIYKRGRGKPVLIKSEVDRHFDFCGYDPNGDLFVDSFNYTKGSSSPEFKLQELHYGSRKVADIKLDQPIFVPGSVQWHDRSLALGDSGNTIYRFAIGHDSGKRVGTTHLKRGPVIASQFWIAGSTVVVGDEVKGGSLGFWDFPEGGEPTHSIPVMRAVAAAVSLASK